MMGRKERHRQNKEILMIWKNWLIDTDQHRLYRIRVITKLPNFEQSYKGKLKTHNYINRQNQSTTGKL